MWSSVPEKQTPYHMFEVIRQKSNSNQYRTLPWTYFSTAVKNDREWEHFLIQKNGIEFFSFYELTCMIYSKKCCYKYFFESIVFIVKAIL